MIGVVIQKHLVNMDSFFQQALPGRAIHEAARRVRRAVSSVASDTEQRCIGKAADALGSRQRQFLIAPALAAPGQTNHCFSSCQKGQLFPISRVGAQNGSHHAACFPGLTAQPIGQKKRFIAKLPAASGSGVAKLPHAAGNHPLGIGKRLRRLHHQQLLCLFPQGKIIAANGLHRIRAGGRIRAGRPRGDHIRRVSQNIGKDNGENLCRGAMLRKTSPLHGGQTLAQRIDLHNVRATG